METGRGEGSASIVDGTVIFDPLHLIQYTQYIYHHINNKQ